MTTSQRGHLAELKVVFRAIEKGFIVSRPVIDARYDFVLDDGKRLLRAQVKYAEAGSSHASGSVVVQLRHFRGYPEKKKRVYEAGEVDLLIVYVPRTEQILAFPPVHFVGKSTLAVRIEAPRNGQKTGLRMASDFNW